MLGNRYWPWGNEILQMTLEGGTFADLCGETFLRKLMVPILHRNWGKYFGPSEVCMLRCPWVLQPDSSGHALWRLHLSLS
jgi:hypothetical protein